MGFRKTSNFQKCKVAPNPTYRIFLNFPKNCALLCLSNVDDIKKKIHCAVFELKAPKAVKDVFNRSYCCYGNLLRYENNDSVITMAGQYFDTMILASSVCTTNHQTLSTGNCFEPP